MSIVCKLYGCILQYQRKHECILSLPIKMNVTFVQLGTKRANTHSARVQSHSNWITFDSFDIASVSMQFTVQKEIKINFEITSKDALAYLTRSNVIISVVRTALFTLYSDALVIINWKRFDPIMSNQSNGNEIIYDLYSISGYSCWIIYQREMAGCFRKFRAKRLPLHVKILPFIASTSSPTE